MQDPVSAPAPLQSLPDPIAEKKSQLWKDASGWRNLTLSAIGLSIALIALPLTKQPEVLAKEITACSGNITAVVGPSGQGRVVGFLSSDQATQLLQKTQSASRMAINPNYLVNIRSLVHLDDTVEVARAVYLVPQGLKVAIGDRVDVTSGYVDQSLPCHYVPNRIVSVQAK